MKFNSGIMSYLCDVQVSQPRKRFLETNYVLKVLEIKLALTQVTYVKEWCLPVV